MKTYKEVVEEGKVAFRQVGEGSVRFVATRQEASDFLDTFAAKIRQATLAEAREKIEGIEFLSRNDYVNDMISDFRAEIDQALTALEDKGESV